MRIKYTVHKSEQKQLRPQTCALTLSSLHPQHADVLQPSVQFTCSTSATADYKKS